MSSFTDKLSTKQLSIIPRRWRLEKGFRYYVGAPDSAEWIDVLSGFVFDGGSIPRAVWFVDAPLGDGAQAYCLHDILYAAEIFPRFKNDQVMLEGLEVLGMGKARRNLIYSQVRWWGWKAYWKHTKESILEARNFVRTSFPLDTPQCLLT